MFPRPGPGAAHLANYLDAVRIAVHQLVPQHATRRHPVIPGHVMEPEQELLRHLAPVGENGGDLRADIARRRCCPWVRARSRRRWRRRDGSKSDSSRRDSDCRPTAPDHSDGRCPRGDAGRAASCSPPPPRANPSSSRPRASTNAGSLVKVMRTHSSAMACADRSGSQARRPKAYQLAWSKCDPVQLRSAPMFDTPAMPVFL